MAGDEQKVIFSMVRVSKTHGQRHVLRDISLGFFYGAKIGVLGLNGAGKSTLLRIMAETQEPSDGQVVRAPGYQVGLLEQEPDLCSGATVRQVVEEGASEAVALLAEYDRISEAFAEPMDDDEMQRLLDQQAEVQDRIEAIGAWELDSRLELAMDALRCPPADTVVDGCPAASAAGSPCAACSSGSPTSCSSTSPPTTSTPSRWVGSSAT